MIDVAVPGYGDIHLTHLVLDYNGTVAVDGKLLAGVGQLLTELSQVVAVHVVTADTFGKAATFLEGIPCRLSVLPEGEQDQRKQAYVNQLGADTVCCIGNGRNDRLMLEAARLGIAVILAEGAAAQTVVAADVVCTNILSALELLQHPLRLAATLRS